VVKRKIPSPCWESNPRTPIVQPIAQHYTDWAIMARRIRRIWLKIQILYCLMYTSIWQSTLQRKFTDTFV
jgi:hypothetical protein